jgi:superfamily II DNA/RNA helicase
LRFFHPNASWLLTTFLFDEWNSFRRSTMPKDKSNERRSNRRDAPYDPQHRGKKDDRGNRKHGGGDDTSPVSTFEEMKLKPDLLRGIYAYGFEKPSAIQQRAIRPIVRGRDVIAQSQSGTGKTAVFSISALQLLDETSRDVQVLILSPTRELAEQSQKVVQSLGDFMNVRTVARVRFERLSISHSHAYPFELPICPS